MPRSGVNGTYSLPGAQATQVPGTPIPSAVNNQGWSDIEQTFNTIQPEAYGGTGASTYAQARSNLGAAATADIRGQIYGLTLSNNAADATNDIDIAAGSAVDSGGVVSMSLASVLTKRLDAAWTVGSNQGGLDTGSIANTSYHVYLIRRPDTGVVDALFSASASSPTLPANYTQFRRIGSIVRSGAAIQRFTQRGDYFNIVTPPLDVSVANPGTLAVTRTLGSIPIGIVVLAKVMVNVGGQAGSVNGAYLSALTESDDAAGISNAQVFFANVATGVGTSFAEVWTNNAAQIRTRILDSDSTTDFRIRTIGWVDNRGAI